MSEGRDQIGESEPKPAAEGASAGSADAAHFIAGKDGQVTTQSMSKETTNG